MAENLTKLPDNLPIPQDDGACTHLINTRIPSVSLPSTQHAKRNLSELQGWVVIFCYPMTGRPDRPIPSEWNWNQIPGARGCTPQACSYRDQAEGLEKLGAQVFGLSTQSTEDQLEAVQRLHLPYTLVSDSDLQFTKRLNLPTFSIDGLRLNKRVTIIAFDGIIQHYFYPVFPPDKNVENVISWLKQHV